VSSGQLKYRLADMTEAAALTAARNWEMKHNLCHEQKVDAQLAHLTGS
jgi:hypothetical protein